MSAGFVPSVTVMKFTLSPDSPSMIMMRTWINTMKSNSEIMFCDATLSVPSLKLDYVYTKGALINGKSLPDLKKILEPIEFEIQWEKEEGANA